MWGLEERCGFGGHSWGLLTDSPGLDHPPPPVVERGQGQLGGSGLISTCETQFGTFPSWGCFDHALWRETG